MAHRTMAYIVIAYTVMAYIVIALHSHGLQHLLESGKRRRARQRASVEYLGAGVARRALDLVLVVVVAAAIKLKD